jgi:hypothetical protein
MLYVNYSPDGSPLGFYNDDIHAEIPGPSIKITEAEWRDCIDNTGRRKVDVAAKKIVIFAPEPPSLESLKTAKNVQINDAVEAAILAGFNSSAIGTSYFYPADRDSQTNLIGSVATGASMGFPCRDGAGVWDRRAHTAPQLKQVLANGAVRKQTLLSQADVFRASVKAVTASGDATTDKAAIDAIVVSFT